MRKSKFSEEQIIFILRQAEKMEIIRLVEHSELPARVTLPQIGIPPSAFYGWYQRYLEKVPRGWRTGSLGSSKRGSARQARMAGFA